jgi:homocysteine S-methyltransferase
MDVGARFREPLVLDGGLASELERLGADLSDALWSARLLVEDPDLIRRVHRAYVEAGADVAISASYQASFEGFARRGVDRAGAARLMRRSVELAREATDEDRGDRRSLVAASVGPYGAVLADGSEYDGRYGLTVDELAAFHEPRLDVLLDAGADVLAIETIPSVLET